MGATVSTDHVAEVMLRSVTYQVDDKTYLIADMMDWHEVPFFYASDVDDCQDHEAGICNQCLRDWSIDYFVRVTDVKWGRVIYSVEPPKDVVK